MLAMLIVEQLSPPVFRFLARRRMPGLAALFCRITLRTLKETRLPNIEKVYTMLILPRVIFTEDVVSSFGEGGEYRILMPLHSMIKALADGFLPLDLDSNTYRTDDPAVKECKRAYREFLTRMWAKLQPYIQVDVVVTASFAYYAERELATALESLGIPFIAMFKESFKSPGYVDFAVKLYRERRGPFTGRRILVYNDIEREIQIDSGIIDPERVTVCGMPRLDRIHRWRRANAGKETPNTQRPQILFFSFIPSVALPRIPRKGGNADKLNPSLENLSWHELTRLTYQAILRLAEETPEVDIVIKSKVGTRDREQMYELLGDIHLLPGNVKIVVGGDPFELITQCQVVCGFNTTALLEAMAAGKLIIIPRFAEVLDERMFPYIVDLGGAVDYARSPEELITRLREEAIARRSVPEELDAGTIRVLDHWVGNSDGRASERVRSAVLAEINQPVLRHISEIHG